MRRQTLFAAAAVVACLAGPLPAASESDMLERSLRGVVTVAGYKVKSVPLRDSRGQLKQMPILKTRDDDLYRRVLDLSGAVQTGSGFIIEHKGRKYVVTNAHVVAAAADEPNAVAVFGADQKRRNVKVVAADSFYDIAVLAFVDDQPGDEFVVLKFRQTPTRVGEKVWALGNPLGKYPHSVSDGIVGGKNRSGLMLPFGYLQTTATIIWGNSGGPCIDAAGNVVGVNTRLEAAQRHGQHFIQPQLNFALDSTIAQRVVDELLTKGRVSRPYFGFLVVQDFALRRTPQGMAPDPNTGGQPVIADVVAGSPAAKALTGKTGAKLLAVNNTPVRSAEEALTALEGCAPGSKVTLVIQTGKAKQTVTFTCGEMNDKALAALAKAMMKRLGYTAAEGNRGVSIRSAGRAPIDPPRPGGSPGGAEDPRLRPGPRQIGPRGPYGPYRRRGPYPFMQFDYRRQQDGFRRLQRQPDDLLVVAVGQVNGEGEGLLWRVSSLAELGLACRLIGLGGLVHIAYANEDGRSCSILQCRLSESRNVFTRVVLF